MRRRGGAYDALGHLVERERDRPFEALWPGDENPDAALIPYCKSSRRKIPIGLCRNPVASESSDARALLDGDTFLKTREAA
jgi:hypothetical protein